MSVAAPTANTQAKITGRARQPWLLVSLLLAEIVIFSIFGTNFLSQENLFEIPRLSVELGLLALALTLVIVTGGIDLSVGSLLGLCAVLFGKLWRDAGLPPLVAASITLVIGGLAGAFNALLISRLRIPPLIVTLGSLSLFRGIAEGITHGADNFTNFPAGFLFLGQGYLGPLPTQMIILIAASVVFYFLLHRSTIGRSLCAIGYSQEGALYAGIPVRSRLALVYILSGVCAALAAIVYVARVGQAKADAGMGYELSAITAVVLGGTSIFGGSATVIGSLLGLLLIATLQNGLRLADLPPELTGIVTGLLLLLAIGSEARVNRKSPAHSTNAKIDHTEEMNMRNSQLAVLCGVILIAALLIVGGNWMLVRSITNHLSQTPAVVGAASASAVTTITKTDPTRTNKSITIGMMPKSKGNAYFIACRQGAEEAARELGVKLLWDGPTDPDPAKQNEIAEMWITRGVDVIAVSVENRDGISTALRKARAKGIKVVTWDSDAQADSRDFFVNQATPQGIGTTLMDNTAAAMGSTTGEFAIITASLTASNQNEWIKYAKARCAEKYPNISLVTIRPCDDLQSKAFDEATTILNAHPNVKVLMAVCSPAVPGAAEAVKQAGRAQQVKVVGLGLPNENKKYVHEGITQGVVLWNTMDLGYLTVYTSKGLVEGTLKTGDVGISAGRLGTKEVRSDNVLLGVPFTFDRSNIDGFDF